jgi:hypothetical protein
MNIKDWILSFVEAALWYCMIYYSLFSIKNPVNLYHSALIILVLVYAATIACPFVRHMQAWKDLWKE